MNTIFSQKRHFLFLTILRVQSRGIVCENMKIELASNRHENLQNQLWTIVLLCENGVKDHTSREQRQQHTSHTLPYFIRIFYI